MPSPQTMSSLKLPQKIQPFDRYSLPCPFLLSSWNWPSYFTQNSSTSSQSLQSKGTFSMQTSSLQSVPLPSSWSSFQSPQQALVLLGQYRVPFPSILFSFHSPTYFPPQLQQKVPLPCLILLSLVPSYLPLRQVSETCSYSWRGSLMEYWMVALLLSIMLVCFSAQFDRGRVLELQELVLELQTTVLTLELERLKVVLMSSLTSLTSLTSYLAFVTLFFLKPMSSISMMFSYFLSLRFFLSSGLLFTTAIFFQLLQMFSSILTGFMAATDLTWLCELFSSLTLTLEFSFSLVLVAFTLEFEDTLDYLMLIPDDVLVLTIFRLAVDACYDFAIMKPSLFSTFDFGFKPRLMLELVLMMLLQLGQSCFESDRYILDVLSEKPSFLEFAMDFLLLISSRLELIRFNNFGSVNREFSFLLLYENSCFFEHSKSFFQEVGVSLEFRSLSVPLCDSSALDLPSSMISFSSGISYS